MGKKFFLSFQHFKENRTWWIFCLCTALVVTGYGIFQYKINHHLRRNSEFLAERCLNEKARGLVFGFAPGEKESVNQALDKLNLAYILTDSADNPLEWHRIRYPRFSVMRGAPILPSDPPFILKEELTKRIAEFKAARPPIIPIASGNVSRKFKIYYQFPFWMTAQPWFLALELVILGVFIYITYTGIKNRDLIRQANLWVNFAKETAHQLGTPLSSLFGWLEMLKMKLAAEPAGEDSDKVKYVLDEAIEDVKKLNKRVFRFSQIGSDPELSPGDLNEIIKEIIAYFRDRLPRAERTIQIVANYDTLPPISLNRDLMGWVIENLLKNSMDAIQKKEGIIQIETVHLPKEGKVRITHTDNGSGIKRENVGKIFNPGFSTKKHGWGLGLALARRIVTDTHLGQIFVESTQVDRGTTFVIELPVQKEMVAK